MNTNIPVTEAMIDAGIEAMDEHDRRLNSKTVTAIYLAMHQASAPTDEADPSLCSHPGTCEDNLRDQGGAFCANLPTAPTDEVVDEFLREAYRRAFNDGAESTVEQWHSEVSSGDYNKLNSGAPTMPHSDCLKEGSWQFVEDMRPSLLALTAIGDNGLVAEAVEEAGHEAYNQGFKDGFVSTHITDETGWPDDDGAAWLTKLDDVSLVEGWESHRDAFIKAVAT